MSNPLIACVGEGLVVLVADEAGPLENSASFTRSVGGAEVNVALGLRHRNIRSALLTRVGDDGFGRHLVGVAAGQGVDVSGVQVDPARATGLYVKERGGDTGTATDLGAGASRMHYFRAGSASSAFSTDYLAEPTVAALLDEAAIIHTTGITPALSPSASQMVSHLLSRPRANQLVSFDVNWRPALWRDRETEGVSELRRLASLSDIVLIGASEALVLYGSAEPDTIRAALPEPRWLIIKNDGNAATGFDRARRVEVAALTADVVETIGAGDAFAAGFLAAHATGHDLESSIGEAHRLALVALGSTGDHVGAP